MKGPNMLEMTKRGRAALVLVLVGLVCASAWSQKSTLFESPFRVKTKVGAWIDVGDGCGYAGPTVADVDGDGRQDLVVGQFERGLFRFYRNVGTVKQPAFEPHRLLKADENQASVPMG